MGFDLNLNGDLYLGGRSLELLGGYRFQDSQEPLTPGLKLVLGVGRGTMSPLEKRPYMGNVTVYHCAESVYIPPPCDLEEGRLICLERGEPYTEEREFATDYVDYNLWKGIAGLSFGGEFVPGSPIDLAFTSKFSIGKATPILSDSVEELNLDWPPLIIFSATFGMELIYRIDPVYVSLGVEATYERILGEGIRYVNGGLTAGIGYNFN